MNTILYFLVRLLHLDSLKNTLRYVLLLQCKRTGILNFTESTPTYLYADINTEQIIYDCNTKSTADLYFLAQG